MRMLMMLVATALLFSGCTQTAESDNGETPPFPTETGGGTTPGPGVAPQEGLQEDIEGGLHLVGVLSPCDAGHCVALSIENEGTTTYHYSSICTSPWSEGMARDGEAVQHREPMFTCQAFGTSPLAPGERQSGETSWNERLWSDEQNAYEDAPQGAYQWTIHYRAYESDDGANPVTLSITFDVIVGET